MKIYPICFLLIYTLISCCCRNNPSKPNRLMEQQIERPPEYLYKIISYRNWQESKTSKTLKLSSDDDNFIHLSTKQQLNKIMKKYWSDVPKFVVLKLSTKKLKGKLVYETNPNGMTKYYHLYNGFIPFDAIVDYTIY